MDTLSRDLLPELECPVCFEYMAPPITFCENGHNICNSCKPKLSFCPTCKGQFMNARCLALEKLALKIFYPCKYRQEGCKDVNRLDSLQSHQAQCPYRSYRCPFHIVKSENCCWEGHLSEIKQHMKSQHSQSNAVREVPRIHSNNLPNLTSGVCYQALFRDSDIFFMYSKATDYFLYSCILYVGPKNKANEFKYRLTIKTATDDASVTAYDTTYSHEESVEDIFKNGKCPSFNRDFIRRCIKSEKLVVEIEIYKR